MTTMMYNGHSKQGHCVFKTFQESYTGTGFLFSQRDPGPSRVLIQKLFSGGLVCRWRWWWFCDGTVLVVQIVMAVPSLANCGLPWTPFHHHHQQFRARFAGAWFAGVRLDRETWSLCLSAWKRKFQGGKYPLYNFFLSTVFIENWSKYLE